MEVIDDISSNVNALVVAINNLTLLALNFERQSSLFLS